MHLVSISNFPPSCASQQLPAFIFWSKKSPPRLSAIFCMYLHVSSFISFQCLGPAPHLSTTFCAHPVSISNFPFPSVPLNFLHPFRFIRRLPHWPLHHFLCFCCFNIRTSLAPTTSCMHLVSISKFHPPCARSKKRMYRFKKEGANVQKHPAQCERL